jgi:phosphate transport system protein
MIRQLIRALRRPPEGTVTDDLERMLVLAGNLARQAGRVYFDGELEDEGPGSVKEQDASLNQLQRQLRRRLLARLAAEERPPSSMLLSLMSLTKDAERLGDYAKNLTELVEIRPGGPPPGPLRERLEEVRAVVEQTFDSVGPILSKQDEDEAREWLSRGKKACRECERIILDTARSEYTAADAISLALGARYYKRLQAHLNNLLTSVVNPLPDLDFAKKAKRGGKGKKGGGAAAKTPEVSAAPPSADAAPEGKAKPQPTGGGAR